MPSPALEKEPRELVDALQQANGRMKTILTMVANIVHRQDPEALVKIGRLLKQEGY